MIDQGHVHRLPNQGQAAGEGAVGWARERCAAGMIVGQDQPRATVTSRIGDDLSKRKRRRAVRSVMPGQVDAARLIVEMGDPDMFARRIALREATREESPGCVKPVKQQRGFGTLMEHEVGLKRTSQ